MPPQKHATTRHILTAFDRAIIARMHTFAQVNAPAFRELIWHCRRGGVPKEFRPWHRDAVGLAGLGAALRKDKTAQHLRAVLLNHSDDDADWNPVVRETGPLPMIHGYYRTPMMWVAPVDPQRVAAAPVARKARVGA